MTIELGALKFKLDDLHMDANETAFFARELESIEAKIYEVKRKELVYRKYVPVSNRDHEGTETITYRMFDMVGAAKIISNYASDLPRADVFGEEFTQRVKSIGASIGFSDQELRASAKEGKSLDTQKATAMRRAVREKESDILFHYCLF